MDTAGEEAAIVFHVRWMPDDDDDDSPRPDDLPPSSDIALSESQGLDTKSNISALFESVRSEDLYPNQRGGQVESSQQLAHKPMNTSFHPELIRSFVGPVNNGNSTSLSDKYISAEPWNPLAVFGMRHIDTSTQTTYRKTWYPGSKLGTSSTYHTATSYIYESATSGTGGLGNAITESSSEKTGYLEMLRSTGIWPVDPQLEQNWSGRGQHVEFISGDFRFINKLLIVQKSLGGGASGYVEMVKCHRISLARKTIPTRKCRFTKDQAIDEVAHMNRLKHSHVIRLISTYIREENLCILMYPAADHNLEEFLKTLGKGSIDETGVPSTAKASSCLGFFSCLSSALRYIHGKLTKHMDIKPQNVLVQTRCRYIGGGRSEYNSKVYIPDFGIARSYQSIDAVNTDGHTVCTLKYAAPEVVRSLGRDLSADVFSLGCVFLEMFAALDSFTASQAPNARFESSTELQETQDPAQSLCKLQEELQRLFKSNHLDRSSQGNLNPIKELLTARIPEYKGTSVLRSSTLKTILEMIQFVPHQRPTADNLVRKFGEKACCKTGPEELEAVEEVWESNVIHDLDRIIEEIPQQQSGETVSDKEKIRSATFWDEPAMAGLTKDYRLLRQLDGGVEPDPIYQSLLMSHMRGGVNWDLST